MCGNDCEKKSGQTNLNTARFPGQHKALGKESRIRQSGNSSETRDVTEKILRELTPETSIPNKVDGL
jgi:hypothetical protein